MIDAHVKLPSKLTQEPLVDAVFELRFRSTVPVSQILPGVLYQSLVGLDGLAISQLPAAQIPAEIRATQAQFGNAALVMVSWKDFAVQIGDASVSVACRLPYPGWTQFKATILKICRQVHHLGIMTAIDRCSLKYVDLIQSGSLLQQAELFNWEVSAGGYRLSDLPGSVTMNVLETPFVHLLSLLTGGSAQFPTGEIINGAIVSVDTSATPVQTTASTFIGQLDDFVERMHAANKRMFFKCLTEKTIESLGAIYE